jgi:hypothetical protein
VVFIIVLTRVIVIAYTVVGLQHFEEKQVTHPKALPVEAAMGSATNN